MPLGALVVGAGPAGALAAHQLARHGVSVLLVDRAAFPRGKVCGCCLSGAALAVLAAAGLPELATACGAVPLREVRLASGRWSAEVRSGNGVALLRERFDAALVEQAIAAGAAFLPDTWAALGSVTTDCREVLLAPVRSHGDGTRRVILAADGLGGNFLARAGVGDSPPEAGSRVGAGVVCPLGPTFYRPGVVYMVCGQHGYLGLVRLEDGRLDLAAAFDASWLRKWGKPGAAAAALLDEVGWPAPENLTALPWRGTPALTRRPQRRAAERVLVLGDAAGYVEPFTGEGMAWACRRRSRSVHWLPKLLRAGSRAICAAWPRRFQRLIVRTQFACRAAAFVLRRPSLTRLLIAILARARPLARPFFARLHAPLAL